MKVIFAGTPAFSLSSLEALVAHPRVELVAVFTQPDRPAGRGRKLVASAVKQRAAALGIPVFQPEKLSTADAVTTIKDLAPDLIVVTAYGLMLPAAVLAIPPLGCVNVHASLLPRWRGAAPIQRAIEAGDRVTGVTLMQMETGLDSGPMLSSVAIRIEPDDTGGSLQDRLAVAGGQLLSAGLDAIADQSLQPEEQNHAEANYASKLNRAEAVINWNESAVVLERRIRAFNPWPVAATSWQGETLRLLMAELVEETDELTTGSPGEVLSVDRDGIMVGCGEGAIRLTRLQRAGGKPVAVRDFLNGADMPRGTILG